jgi:Tol biopolymer transport system component
MALSTGTRLGAYEIQIAIGVGGMGEVYQARDLKLDRSVALKILPESFAHDPDRLARFQREAKALAALNHPNIAIIHGFEEAHGIQALVMELVEGPTLADRIAEGPIPLDDALPIAKQIADALEAAHEQGIIHRDLKPANVKLRPDGTVKVLDFGLAKLVEVPSAARPVDVTASPTITSPALMTGIGVLLGTAAYMSPEQAKGRPADKRSDVWAFGCVLYEMLTGARAFAGDDVSDTLAAVLRGEPDWRRLPTETPTSIRRLLRRCLEKDRKRRLSDAADARLEVDDALLSPTPDAQTDATPALRVPLWRKAIPAAAVIIVGLAAGYGGWTLKPSAPRPVARFAINLTEGDTFTAGRNWVALSPDGTRLAYAANNRLYLLEKDQLTATPIAGGQTAVLASPRNPFFSPDGQSIGFWEAGQLKKVSVSGGAPVILCAISPPPFGATWATDNTILFGDGNTGIWRVSGNGGTAERIITVDAGQRTHGPQLLPDGRTVLFTLAQSASWDEAQIVVQSLDGGTRKTVIGGGTDGRYLATGHLVYALGETVLAVPFDTTSLSIRGGPVPIIEGVRRQTGATSAPAQFAVSSEGTLAYVPLESSTPALRTLAWVDRRGREEAIPAPPRSYRQPRISLDGTRLAVVFPDEKQNVDIWVWGVAGGTWTRVTSDPDSDGEPVWTPDGQRLIFTSMRTGEISLYRQAANGTGIAERLIELNRQSSAMPGISPDGRHVVLREAESGNSYIAIVDLGPDRGRQALPIRVGESKPLVKSEFEEYNAEISPDGRWLAYQSNRSGTFEVYVQPFPDVASGLWPVSTTGGTEPVWARDGRELFYRAPNGAVMGVSIMPGSPWKASPPTQLFAATSYTLAGVGTGLSRTYDVSPDGRRFLMMKNSDAPTQTSTAPRIVVVQNWFEELKRLAPTK